jgi:hypothetical protein
MTHWLCAFETVAGTFIHSPGRVANHPNSGTVIRCLTIAIQDAVALNIALELIMPGRPPQFLDEQIKQPTVSRFAVGARP